jgi:uncharacterized membrane protein
MRSHTTFITFAFLITGTTAQACTSCNRDLQQAIYDSTFYPNLLVMLSAFIVLALIIILLARLATRHYSRLSGPGYLNPVPLTTVSAILGIGLGGFVDGIVLHQLLQWHEMLSNKIATTTYLGKSVNMFWDGVFHFFCLCVVITGVILLWKLLFRKDVNLSGRLFSGGLLIGWGLFNIVEGIIDHHLIKLHNVKEISASPELWNLGFLGCSIVLIVAGLLIARHAVRQVIK